jgi:maleylacetoacetate isomerase
MTEPNLTLYSYFRSSAAFRVRIALALKGLRYDTVPVHLLREGGENRKDWFRAVNPQMRVPALAVERDGTTAILVQSPAILEWLEETWPEPPLLPRDPLARAKARAIAASVSCDIHPLNNVSVLRYLKRNLDLSQEARDAWYAHWITAGFAEIEPLVEAGPYACGSAPTFADICLVPQVFNARRFKVPLDPFPKIVASVDAAMALDAFIAAEPGRQPDAE